MEVGRQSAVQNENKLEEVGPPIICQSRSADHVLQLEQTIAFNEVKNNEALRLVNEDVATYDDVDKLLSAASGPVQDRFELAERVRRTDVYRGIVELELIEGLVPTELRASGYAR